MIVPGITFVQGKNDYTDGDNKKYGIAIHNTSNDASDEAEAAYATRRTDGISSHFYTDGDSIIQSIDTVDKCGHAGSSTGNENAVAFELTGANEKSRDWWLANIAWDKVGEVIAYLINHDPNYKDLQVRRASVSEMKSNPKVRAFYGHDDMRQAWGGTTHTDPGPNFPWDRLFKAVNDSLGGGGEEMSVADVRTGMAQIYDEAANRSTPTGRNVGDDMAKLDARALAPVQEKLDTLLAKPPVQAAPVDITALVAALAPEIRMIVREELDNTRLTTS